MVQGRKDMGFDDPLISSLEFLVNKNFDDRNFEGIGDIGVSLNSNRIEIASEEERHDHSYLTNLTITAGKKSSNYPFYIKVEISAVFYLDIESEVDEKVFVNSHAAAILYSYVRPIISDTVAKAGFPPFNLPFMNFTKVDNKQVDIVQVDNKKEKPSH